MQALEVGHLGLVAGLDERLEADLHEFGGAAAEHGLLAEEVRLGLLLEGGADDAGAGRADALGPGEGGLHGLAGDVLLDRDEGGHALALDILGADDVAGALGGDHGDVHVLLGLDQLVVDGEPVDEEHGLAALAEIGGDVAVPDVGLLHVGDADEHDVRAADGLGGLIDLEALLLRGGGGLGALVEAHDHVEPAVAQVHGVGVALGAEAEDGEGLVLQEAEVGVLVGVHFGRHWFVGGKGLSGLPSCVRGKGRRRRCGRTRGCRRGR